MTEPLIVYVFVWTLVAIAILLVILDIVLWKILRLSKKEEKEEIGENNIVEFVWEDENWNWFYRIR